MINRTWLGKPIAWSGVSIHVNGVILRGEMAHPVGDGPWPAAILLHGLGAGRKVMRAAAAELARRGFVALIYDMRGHGDSEGVYAGEGADDLVMVYRWFREHPQVMPERIGLVGHSLGGRIVLIAAAREPSVAATVALSPAPDGPFHNASAAFKMDRNPATAHIYCYPGMRVPGRHALWNWRWNLQMRFHGYRLRIDWVRTMSSWNDLPLMEAVKIRAAKPLLLVQGRLDHLVPYEHTQMLYWAARPPKELWVIPIGLHGTLYRFAVRPSWINWLCRHLTSVREALCA